MERELLEGSAPKYSDVIWEAFPGFLVYGMTEEQYLDGDAELTRVYQKAYMLKRKEQNAQAWVQGAYFYHALVDVSPILRAFSKAKKPADYLKEPFPFNTDEEEEQNSSEKAYKNNLAMMEMFAIGFNKRVDD